MWLKNDHKYFVLNRITGGLTAKYLNRDVKFKVEFDKHLSFTQIV